MVFKLEDVALRSYGAYSCAVALTRHILLFSPYNLPAEVGALRPSRVCSVSIEVSPAVASLHRGGGGGSAPCATHVVLLKNGAPSKIAAPFEKIGCQRHWSPAVTKGAPFDHRHDDVWQTNDQR